MTSPNASAAKRTAVSQATESVIRISLILLLAVLCGAIIAPFFVPILWGAILAVALFPLYKRLEGALNGRSKTAATLFTLVALALLLTPTVILVGDAISSVVGVASGLRDGTLTIQPPPDNVVSWPVIGSSLNDLWVLASTNLDAALEQYHPQLVGIAEWLLAKAGSTAGSVLGFAVSIIIAGIFLALAKPSVAFLRKLNIRLVGDFGDELTDMSGATVRSVAQGVLGVALIQGLAAGVILLLFGVPWAGLIALAVLFFAIMQLPAILVLAPVIAFYFTIADTVPAVIFAILALLVGMADNVLKPLLLGRGVATPMPIVLIGAIGGMIAMGMLGLFVGAVILSIGYSLFMAWLDVKDNSDADDGEPSAEAQES